MRKSIAIASSFLASLAACRVGPDYRAPAASVPSSYSASDAPTSVVSTTVEAPAEIAEWWRVFGDDTLEGLVTRALDENLDLAAAEARIRQARAARTIAGAARYPEVDVSASAQRTSGPTVSGGRATESLFRTGFDASWELDLFGGVRRGVEAADADLAATVLDREAVRVSLVAEVATTYFDLRAAQRELDAVRGNLDSQRQSVDITQQRQRAGFVGALDVTNARAQVALTTARIPSLETQIAQDVHALSALLAREPGALRDELTTTAALPNVPNQVAIGVPSDLIRRRPDIRRAEADLHAATARIGVATADLYPRVVLGASVGASGDRGEDALAWKNRFLSIGPTLSWPLFDAGRRRAGVELQEALSDEAFVRWRASVVLAMQEVEDALVAYAKEQERRAALAESLRIDVEAVDLSTQLYTAGRTDFLNVLSAQRSRLEAEEALAQSDRNVLTNLVAVYKALGGGWEADDLGSDSVAK